MTDLFDLLRGNAYPGRGIMLGRSADDKYAVIAYFIMGRSVNSRNRVFVTDGDGIRTEAFDPSKLSDPSLIIYAPVRTVGDMTIVTNGDQTDTVHTYLEKGLSFEDALRTRTFEPDGPNWTPRISGVVDPDGSFILSILKSREGDEAGTNRFFFDYQGPQPGAGRFISTYQGDGSPLPSFAGEPIAVSIGGGIDEFGAALWDSLNEDNKVSLFVRYIDLKDGTFDTRIYNKNERGA